VSVDGGDVLECYRVFKELVDSARAGGGPAAVEVRTVRLTAHSSDDSDRYRSKELVASLKAQDPITRFREDLVGRGVLDDAAEEQIRAEVKAQIQEAEDEAAASPDPDPATLADHVYAS
jgi:TPP-dependent pyruvate/acetoin dehydrogenase alpha subunit